VRAAQSEFARRSDDQGFTLIELLVAMTLLAMLSVGLVAGIRYGTRIWQASAFAAAQDRQMLAAQTALKESLERAYPAFISTTATDGHVEFDGRIDGFSVLSPDSQSPGALLQTTVETQKDGDTLALVSVTQPELGFATSATSRREILLRRIGSCEFSYYGRASPSATPMWQTQWQRRSRLPDLVRVRIAFADRTAHTRPEFIVGTRVGADVSCAFDVLTKNCLGRR